MFDLYNFNVTSKPVHHKYFYEVAAIPKDIRMQYLKKLEKRINSYNQKNVKLLKIIYWHIEEDEKLKWDERKICNILKISKNMLYVYKSNILRDLRKLYFNWDEIEKKEFNNRADYDDKFTIEFLKAEKMFNVGMRREAKAFFLKLEEQIIENKRIKIVHKIVLLKMYSYLFLHNISKNPLSHYYLNKLDRLAKYLINTNYVKERPDLKSEILIIKYNSSACKSIVNLKTNQACLKAVEFFELSLKEAKLINNFSLKSNYHINISLKLADLYIDLEDYKNANLIIKEGIELCKKNNLINELMVFETFLLWIKLRSGKEDSNITNITNQIDLYYKNADYFKDNSALKCKFLNRCASISSLSSNGYDIGKFSYYFYEYISAMIMSNGVNSILRALYFIKFVFYFSKIQLFTIRKNNNQKKYFTVVNADKRYHKKLYNTIDELLTNFNKINDIYFRHNFYCFMLDTEFWKGLDCDFEKAKYILKQIKWISSTRGKMLNHNKITLEVLNTGMLMMEDFRYMNKERFLIKYEQSFKALSFLLFNNSIGDTTEDVLSTYSLFSFIAEQIGYKELIGIVEELYFKFEDKYPEIFIPFLKKIEEEQDNIPESTLNDFSSNAA